MVFFKVLATVLISCSAVLASAQTEVNPAFVRPLVRPTIALVISIDISAFGLKGAAAKTLKTLRTNQLVQEFNAVFTPTGLGLRVYRDGDAQVLAGELENPSNVGVFFVSNSTRPVSDRYGVGVARLFKRVHPNIKVLGLVSANADAFFDQIALGRDDLHVFAGGLRDIARKAEPFVKDHSASEQSCRTELGVRLHVVRYATRAPQSLGTAIVEVAGQVIAVFGPRSMGESRQEQWAWISLDALAGSASAQGVRAIVYGDETLAAQRFEINLADDASRDAIWVRDDVFPKSHGSVITQSYQPAKEPNYSSQAASKYFPFACVQRLQLDVEN